MRKFLVIAKMLTCVLPLLGGVVTGNGILVGLSLTFSSSLAIAAEKAAKQSVSAKVGKPLQEAQKFASQKKFQQALTKVNEAQAITNKTPFEEYKVQEFLAYVQINLKNYAAAAKAYDYTINSGLLPPAELPQRLGALTQIYYQAKNYPQVIKYGNRYLKEVGPDVDQAQSVAQAYYVQNDFAHAAVAMQQLITIATKLGKPVTENWLQLLMSSQYKQNKTGEVVKTLEQLLTLYPSKEYWENLFAYEQSKMVSTDRSSLEVYRLKSATGVLEADEVVELAELAISLGLPGDAQSALEKGLSESVIDSKDKDRAARLLNMAKTQSTDDKKTLAALDTELRAKPTGDDEAKLGEAYLTYGEVAKAVDAIDRGIKKGGLKAADEAHLHLGIAYVQLGKAAKADAEFKAIPATSKYSRLAQLWALHAK